MLYHAFASLADWIVVLISGMGYLGVVILMAIESACIPVPSEVIMPFAGYLVSTGEFSLLGAATMGAVGCNIGSTVAYFVAAQGGREGVERWGAYVLIRPPGPDRTQRVFRPYRANPG